MQQPGHSCNSWPCGPWLQWASLHKLGPDLLGLLLWRLAIGRGVRKAAADLGRDLLLLLLGPWLLLLLLLLLGLWLALAEGLLPSALIAGAERG